MILPDFRLERPRDLFDALQLLAAQPEAVPLAGGTDLLAGMKQGLWQPPVVVDFSAIDELRAVEVARDHLAVGALMPLARVADHPIVRARFPALCQAAVLVASPQIRNRGTLGGNLLLDTRCLFYNKSPFWRESIGYCLKTGGDVCRAAPGATRCAAVLASDTAPALLALDADVVLARWSEKGRAERTLSIAELYGDEGRERPKLRPGEILTQVRLPLDRGEIRSAYRKYALRKAIDFPLGGVAVAFELADARVRKVRIAVGALSAFPRLALEAMSILEDQPLTAELVERAASAVTTGIHPIKNQLGSPSHRRLMARRMCLDALRSLGAPAGGKPADSDIPV